MPSLLFENQGDGRFTSVGERAGPFFRTQHNGRGSGAFDFDNDGRVDLVVTTLGGKTVLLHNVAPKQSHWLTLRLEGTRSNRDGFGARVKVSVGERTLWAEARCPTSYVFQQDARLHFGLGAATRAERVEVRWPSGQTQELTNVVADQVIQVREPGDSRWPAKR